jgi:DNA (cytosine-5)-methyltransferase 1
LFIVMWDERVPDPDLEHRPESWCSHCDRIVEAQWSWRTGVPPTGTVRYGMQYDYRCPSCRTQVFPPMTPSLDALDLTNLGTRIGDRPFKKHLDGTIGPLAGGTMGRAARCLQRMPDFPAVLMPDRTLLNPPAALTGRENAMVIAVNNFQGSPRGVDEPLPTQPGSETLSLVSTGVLPFRKHTIPTVHTEAMPTVTADQIPGLVTASGQVSAGGSAGAQWLARLRELTVDDLLFRMLYPHEIGKACGFDTSFPGRPGKFIVWGSAKEQVDGFGNAVTPGVGLWFGQRLRVSLHTAKGAMIPAQRRPALSAPSGI